MFAFPVLFVSVDGEGVFHDGTLIRLAPELGGTSKIAGYKLLAKSGWHTIDYGYSAYVQVVDSGDRYTFVGLFPNDTKPSKKFGVPSFFSKSEFENFAKTVLIKERDYQRKAEANLNLLVHDLRRLSTSIYHAATSAKNCISDGDLDQSLVRIENVIAAQGMLRIRTDVLDFTGNPSAQQEKEHVPIYRRVDKVVRCFMSVAERKGVSIHLNGSSYSNSFGPNVFEIIPYVIIDNAVKYAPRNSTIDVNVLDKSDSIEIRITSLGPNINPNEQVTIFNRGFRSEAAREQDASGSGIGLFLAKSLVEQFNGMIDVEVSNREISTGVGGCREITFSVSVPIFSAVHTQ